MMTYDKIHYVKVGRGKGTTAPSLRDSVLFVWYRIEFVRHALCEGAQAASLIGLLLLRTRLQHT